MRWTDCHPNFVLLNYQQSYKAQIPDQRVLQNIFLLNCLKNLFCCQVFTSIIYLHLFVT